MNLRSFSTLQLALGASIAVHAALLTVRFVDPESFNRVFEDTPLEVILVNARSNERPDKAKAIAQTSLAGGGDAEQGRATSPLPPSAFTDLGDTLEQESAQQLQTLQEQQTTLLAEVKNQLAALRAPDPRQAPTKAEQAEREAKRRQLTKLLAEIERRINQENSRPRKRYISPATREEVYAVYYDAMRHAIEDRGTENFPQAGGKKLYGELTMVVTVNHDGRVLDTEVAQSSGNATLDRRAAAIAKASGPFGAFNAAMRRQADQILVVTVNHDGRVLDTEVAQSSGNATLDRRAANIARSAGPFGAFNAAMRRQADQILVVSRFKFTRNETLEASMAAQP